MISKRSMGGIALGAGLGAAQTIGFRALDDKLAEDYLTAKTQGKSPNPPFLMKQLGNFGSTSVLINGPLSTAELVVGVYSASKDKISRDSAVQGGLIGAGSAGIVGTIGSMAFPPVQWSNAVQVDPNIPYRGPGSRKVSISGGGPSQSAALGNAVVG
jgi:hypothetical protein